jgi:hypothetical protein
LLGGYGKAVSMDAHTPNAVSPAVSGIESAGVLHERMSFSRRKRAEVKRFGAAPVYEKILGRADADVLGVMRELDYPTFHLDIAQFRRRTE